MVTQEYSNLSLYGTLNGHFALTKFESVGLRKPNLKCFTTTKVGPKL